MTVAFVDTQYFVAIFQKNDQWHQNAAALELRIEDYNFVTTDTVLAEVLNYFCGFRPSVRKEVSALIADVLSDPSFEVIEQTRAEFLSGVEFYESRLDKGYSLTDCISMNVCREHDIEEILTSDKHFSQEGFTVLL